VTATFSRILLYEIRYSIIVVKAMKYLDPLNNLGFHTADFEYQFQRDFCRIYHGQSGTLESIV
jgi:hypothetical protein